MNRWEGLELFVAVVDEGGFSAAARRLGLAKSQVSKKVRRLEERLGARLLHRTTRKLRLTGIGRAFYARAARLVDDLDEAERAVQQQQTVPRGRLRVSLPMSFGIKYAAAELCAFCCGYPELEIDMDFSDRKVDLIDEDFDLAVRVGVLSESTLMARKLAPVALLPVASPAYLATHGAPVHPDDLATHQCLLYSLQRTGDAWSLSREGEETLTRVRGRLRANNGEALRAAAVEGLGIALLPEFIVAEDLAAGRLTRVLPDWGQDDGAVWAVYPESRHLSAKVRLCVDHLAAAFTNDPPWRMAR